MQESSQGSVELLMEAACLRREVTHLDTLASQLWEDWAPAYPDGAAHRTAVLLAVVTEQVLKVEVFEGTVETGVADPLRRPQEEMEVALTLALISGFFLQVWVWYRF